MGAPTLAPAARRCYLADVWSDSHCHLDFPAFAADRRAVVDRARGAGVGQFFVPGVSPRQWARLARMRSGCSGVEIGLGIHPHFLAQLSDWEQAEGLRLLPRRAVELQVRAVGECGLDALSAKRGGASMSRQVDALRAQLGIAAQLRLPVVLHVVRAHGAALELLRSGGLPRGGVLHAYSGPPELVPRYAALGFYFGFGGAVTHERARRARASLEVVPLDRLVLETDAPDQAPVGFEGAGEPGRNEPAALPGIARCIAGIRGLSLDQLQQLTWNNTQRLFAA